MIPLNDTLTKVAVPFWRSRLPKHQPAVDYLTKRRGLSYRTLEHFGVGYNPVGRELARQIDALDGDMSLFVDSRGNDKFQDYVVFPLLRGKHAVGATARYIGKGKRLSHLHLAASIDTVFNYNSVNASQIFVVEAPICAMTLWQAGLNAIATMGNSGTKNLLHTLNPAHKVIMVPDNDIHNAGIEAHFRVCVQLWHAGIWDLHMIHPSAFGAHKDSNDVLRAEGQDALLKIMAHGQIRLADWELFQEFLERSADYVPSTTHYQRSEKEEDILPLIAQFTKLKRFGTRYKGQCPIHGDGNPSLVVYVDTNTFYCFGCRAGGGPKQFRKLMGGV